jgi:hypothetical protein
MARISQKTLGKTPSAYCWHVIGAIVR